ncbi:MAG TPA: CAP domain-containing protein, partial [Coleofasciculaceae cyanobacterium]
MDIDPDGDGLVTGTLVSNASGQEIAFFVGAAPDAVAQAAGVNNGGGSTFTNDVLTAHNSYRSAVGVPPLSWSTSLASDAQGWANQLAASGAFNHAQNTGQGENLARGTTGFVSPQSLVQLWGNEQQFFKMGTFP